VVFLSPAVTGRALMAAGSRHFSSDEVGGDKHEVPEGAGPEQCPVAPSNANGFSAQEVEDAIELLHGRLLFDSHQSVGQGDQQSLRAVAVDVSVGAGKVAERLLDSERARFEEKPLVSGAPASGGNGQPDFERHVESWCPTGELHSAEVMKRIPARRDQLENAVQAPCRAWDLDCGSWAKPEGAETGNQGDEEPFVEPVVGDVEKCVLRRVSLGDRSGSAGSSPPRCGSFRGASLVASSESVGDPCPELLIVLRGDAKDAGRGGKRRVGRRDHRARSQGHGPHSTQ